MRFTRILSIMVVAMALAACSTSTSNNNNNNNNNNANDQVLAVPTLLASGGTSTSGTGGSGGYVHLESYGGAVKVLKSGTVDASFDSSVSTPALSIGTNPAVVSGGTTTVLVDDDPNDATPHLYTKISDGYLYLGNGNGDATDDLPVTELTVNAGSILVLVDPGFGYAPLLLSNYLLVNGTITSTVPSVYIEANLIDVESGGRITTSAMSDGSNAGNLSIGNGNSITKTIINRGTIEAKGLGTGSGGYLYFDADDLIVNYGTIDASGGSSATGCGGSANEIDFYLNNASGKFYSFGSILAKGGDSSDSNSGGYGGSGGYIYIDVPDLVVNTGTIDVSGGNSDADAGGSGGEFDVFVNYGDFNSSGTVRMNGGKGATYGGDTEYWAEYWNAYSAYIETAYSNNDMGRNGDIIISGVWEANGGTGAEGAGGYGGYIYLQTDALGKVTINANMSVKGGDGMGTGSYYGASTYGIDIYQSFDPNGYGFTLPPSAGKISVAGTYDLRGGSGDAGGGSGGYLKIYGNNYSQDVTGADVELVGFAAMNLNGGDGANGGSASGIQLYTYSPGGMPAGPIMNEASIEARGGNSTAPGSTGGLGGTVAMITNGIIDPSEIISNSGNIDISGGTGNPGGDSTNSMIILSAQHVTNSGNLAANGGNGTTSGSGGNGGNIYLNSDDITTPTIYTDTMSVTGGTPGGSDGSINIDTGAPQY